ncbi:MAG: hypothetical protein ACPLRA_01450, partial [Candidatus Saccharicenans sp.]
MNGKYKLWVTLSLIVVFALGVGVGIFGGKMFLEKKKPGPSPRQESFPTLEVISKELGLTPEQEAQIREIFKKSEERFEAFRKEVHTGLKGLRDQLKTEMDSVLTAEQQKKMQELMERYLRQRRRESPERPENKPQTPPDKEKKGE